MSESGGAGFGRKLLGVLCCAGWVVGYGAVCGVLLYYFAGPVSDWVDRQNGILNVACSILVGLGYLFLLGAGFAGIEGIWQAVVHPAAPAGEGRTHGAHAGGATAAACPKCGFKDLWDGSRCGHCRYSGKPWDHGARPAG